MVKIVLVISVMGGAPTERAVEGNVFIDPLRQCEAIADAVKGQAGTFGITAHCLAKKDQPIYAAN